MLGPLYANRNIAETKMSSNGAGSIVVTLLRKRGERERVYSANT